MSTAREGGAPHEVIVTAQIGVATTENRRSWHDYIQAQFQNHETVADILGWAREKADARAATVIKIEIRESGR